MRLILNMKFLVVLLFAFAAASGQTFTATGRVKNFQEYWFKLMQGLIDELEAREWCNLKLDDITQNIDDILFNLQVTGTAHYTNGFVISIQKIDITNVGQSVAPRTVDGVSVPFANVQGRIIFRDLLLGQDVYANLTSPEGEYRATGTFLHSLVQIQLNLNHNLVTKEFSFTHSDINTSVGSGVRMRYMPSSHITEALSRRYAHSTYESAGRWAREILGPILLDIATNKLEFPEVCFNDC